MTQDPDPTDGKGNGFLISVLAIAGLFDAMFVTAGIIGAVHWWTALADVAGFSCAAAVILQRAQWAKTP